MNQILHFWYNLSAVSEPWFSLVIFFVKGKWQVKSKYEWINHFLSKRNLTIEYLCIWFHVAQASTALMINKLFQTLLFHFVVYSPKKYQISTRFHVYKSKARNKKNPSPYVAVRRGISNYVVLIKEVAR